MPESQPNVVLDCRNQLGESILWDERHSILYWINIHAGELWSWTPASNAAPVVRRLSERIGAIGLRQSGGLVMALASGFALYDLKTQKLDRLSEIEPDLHTTRLNDGRVDPAGRFLAGGMDEASPQRPLSALYALDADHGTRLVLPAIHCANSLCWSPDGKTMYFTDMPTRRIDAYDYDVASGTASNRRVFVQLDHEPGLADGSIVDAEGGLWNAQWRGNKLLRFTPDGKLDREIALPISNPTCLAFGGADFDQLYVTTAWFSLSDEEKAREPHAGSLFAFCPGVRGLPEHRYAG